MESSHDWMSRGIEWWNSIDEDSIDESWDDYQMSQFCSNWANSMARAVLAKEPNDGPGPDGNHVITGECFACMVGVATGPESHGDGCPRARTVLAKGETPTESEASDV
jgi:hypothetical protein